MERMLLDVIAIVESWIETLKVVASGVMQIAGRHSEHEHRLGELERRVRSLEHHGPPAN